MSPPGSGRTARIGYGLGAAFGTVWLLVALSRWPMPQLVLFALGLVAQLPLLLGHVGLLWLLDRFRPRDLRRVLFLLFWGGIVSIGIGGFVGEMLGRSFGDLGGGARALQRVLFMPFTEEALKAVAVVAPFWRQPAGRRWGAQQPILDALYVGIGFGIVENAVYMTQHGFMEMYWGRIGAPMSHGLFVVFFALGLAAGAWLVLSRRITALLGGAGFLVAWAAHAKFNEWATLALAGVAGSPMPRQNTLTVLGTVALLVFFGWLCRALRARLAPVLTAEQVARLGSPLARVMFWNQRGARLLRAATDLAEEPTAETRQNELQRLLDEAG